MSDDRNFSVKELLIKKGETVCEFSWDNISNLEKDNIVVFSPAKKFDKTEIEKLPFGIVVYGGNDLKKFENDLKEKSIKYINIMSDEIFTVKNANLTCEGVLALMIEKSKKSLFENQVLILGGGRLAKGLAVLLGRIGVDFSIVSFNPIKYPEYFIYSKNCYFKYSFVDDLKNFDIIINTIPAKILDDEIVNKIADDTIFIETASVDCLDRTKVKNFQFVPAPALPKKYTCQTAGKYLFEMITGENIYD